MQDMSNSQQDSPFEIGKSRKVGWLSRISAILHVALFIFAIYLIYRNTDNFFIPGVVLLVLGMKIARFISYLVLGPLSLIVWILSRFHKQPCDGCSGKGISKFKFYDSVEYLWRKHYGGGYYLFDRSGPSIATPQFGLIPCAKCFGTGFAFHKLHTSTPTAISERQDFFRDFFTMLYLSHHPRLNRILI